MLPRSALILSAALCLVLAACRANVPPSQSELSKRAGQSADAEARAGRQAAKSPLAAEWDAWVAEHVRLHVKFEPTPAFIEKFGLQHHTFERVPGTLFLRASRIPKFATKSGNTLVVQDNYRDNYGASSLIIGMVDLSPDPVLNEARHIEPARRPPDAVQPLTPAAPAPGAPAGGAQPPMSGTGNPSTSPFP